MGRGLGEEAVGVLALHDGNEAGRALARDAGAIEDAVEHDPDRDVRLHAEELLGSGTGP